MDRPFSASWRYGSAKRERPGRRRSYNGVALQAMRRSIARPSRMADAGAGPTALLAGTGEFRHVAGQGIDAVGKPRLLGDEACLPIRDRQLPQHAGRHPQQKSDLREGTRARHGSARRVPRQRRSLAPGCVKRLCALRLTRWSTSHLARHPPPLAARSSMPKRSRGSSGSAIRSRSVWNGVPASLCRM